MNPGFDPNSFNPNNFDPDLFDGYGDVNDFDNPNFNASGGS